MQEPNVDVQAMIHCDCCNAALYLILAAQSNAFTSSSQYNSDSSLRPSLVRCLSL